MSMLKGSIFDMSTKTSFKNRQLAVTILVVRRAHFMAHFSKKRTPQHLFQMVVFLILYGINILTKRDIGFRS